MVLFFGCQPGVASPQANTAFPSGSISARYFIYTEVAPLHIPLPASTSPQDCEYFDEDEQEDFEDCSFTVPCADAVSATCFISQELFKYTPFTCKTQSCPAIPFFILHHCWKSFIAG